MRPGATASTIATTFDALMASGELVDEAAFLERSGLASAQLSNALVAGGVFRLEVGEARGYPAFLLDSSLDRGQVEVLAELLADHPASARFAFFTTPRGSLATPRPVTDSVLNGSGTPRPLIAGVA